MEEEAKRTFHETLSTLLFFDRSARSLASGVLMFLALVVEADESGVDGECAKDVFNVGRWALKLNKLYNGTGLKLPWEEQLLLQFWVSDWADSAK
jgi:hypothetical protein